MAGLRRLSILVADDDPGVVADYRTILCAPRSSMAPDFGDTSHIEDDLFRVALAHDRFPEVALSAAAGPEAAIRAVRLQIDTGGQFAMAFIGVELREGDRGLAAAMSIRAMDPDLPIALVAARCGMHPLDVYEKIPPPGRIAILMKPFHAVEVQHLALSLAEVRWTSETSRIAVAAGLHAEERAEPQEGRRAVNKWTKTARRGPGDRLDRALGKPDAAGRIASESER